jgi:hypothetical protein
MLSHFTVFSVAERRRSPSATNVDKSAAGRISPGPLPKRMDGCLDIPWMAWFGS